MARIETLVEIKTIIDARKILAKHGLSKNAFARDKDGNECLVFSPNAANFCIAGALLRARKEDSGFLFGPFMDYLAKFCQGYKWVAVFNDDPKTTKEDVLAVYDAAIAKLQKQGTK